MEMTKEKLFADLCAGLSEIEARFMSVTPKLPDDEPARPDLHVVVNDDPENDVADVETERRDSKEVAAMVADLNDRFRAQEDPNVEGGIAGEWQWSDELADLPFPTLKAITKKIKNYDDFDRVPLHNQGKFEHKSKNKTFTIIWKITPFADQTLMEEVQPKDDTDQSWRVIVVALSSDTDTTKEED